MWASVFTKVLKMNTAGTTALNFTFKANTFQQA